MGRHKIPSPWGEVRNLGGKIRACQARRIRDLLGGEREKNKRVDLSTGEEVVPTKKTVTAQNDKHGDIIIAETSPNLSDTKVRAG